MFVDASVVVAILAREAGFEEIEKHLVSIGGGFLVSPLVRYEATVALARSKAEGMRKGSKPTPELLQQAQIAVDAFVGAIDAEEMSISPEIGNGALEANALYGKSVGHSADLNFGDCFAYACAKSRNVGLLYKGNDFAKTDLA